eukprot:TRINITY_DN2614_c0_g1_i4.p2 TRINITY_DN2614_c0_g1~~TRINITY_DN2614_c0_g1_i4.p2  ORF type:complete len:131 (+),score=25.33 TRINITY_DN2614_c0_g1_i4:2-394(+)
MRGNRMFVGFCQSFIFHCLFVVCCSFLVFFFFSSRRRHTRSCLVSWARRCVQETVSTQSTWDFAWVERDGERERINMMLIGPQPVGTWAVSYTHLTLPTICSVQISVVAVSLKKKKNTTIPDNDHRTRNR